VGWTSLSCFIQPWVQFVIYQIDEYFWIPIHYFLALLFMYMYQLSIYYWITYDVIVIIHIQDSQTPLMLAISQGHLDVVKYFIKDINASIGDTDNIR
jgi:hypothetical protein